MCHFLLMSTLIHNIFVCLWRHTNRLFSLMLKWNLRLDQKASHLTVDSSLCLLNFSPYESGSFSYQTSTHRIYNPCSSWRSETGQSFDPDGSTPMSCFTVTENPTWDVWKRKTSTVWTLAIFLFQATAVIILLIHHLSCISALLLWRSFHLVDSAAARFSPTFRAPAPVVCTLTAAALSGAPSYAGSPRSD